jgi:hypothetical protein
MHAQAPFFWKCEAAAAALLVFVRLSHFILCLRSTTRPLAREEERLTHIAELACGRSGAENQAQEREKNGTSGVHGNGQLGIGRDSVPRAEAPVREGPRQHQRIEVAPQ